MTTTEETINEAAVLRNVDQWFKDGMNARDTGASTPHRTGTLQHMIAVKGWVYRDLQLCLARAKPGYRRSQLASGGITDELIRDESKFERHCPLVLSPEEEPPLSALAFIEHLAQVSEAVGWQAGVGGCETAGAVISYLAEHPDKFDLFMAQGFLGLWDDLQPEDMHRAGRLSWHANDGKVWSPQQARDAVAAKRAAEEPRT